jgi:CubicO group peptidase (beta-lactamase class C family)
MMNRRQLIRGAAGAAVAGAVGALRPTPAEAFAPPTVTPDDIVFRTQLLRRGTPAEVGLLADRVARVRADLSAYLEPTADHPTHPSYAGAVVLAAKDGVVVLREAVGKALRYASPSTELPAEQQLAATTATIYDLASMSKLFVCVTLMQLVERGRIDLDAPVASYLPEFAAGGKPTVTVRHLLTHTSGLPAFRPLYSEFPTPDARLAGALATPVTPATSPGSQYVYSDLGLIALGVIVERATGLTLDGAVHNAITGPLSMKDTGYRPDPKLKHRIAATEFEDYVGRGLVWGEVHDENAWSLGGVAGHAGLFSTVDDLAVFSQMLLNGGHYRGRRILREATVRQMLVNYNAHLEDRFPDSDRGLGFELNKHTYMGGLASPVTFGHTGFTGTSVVIDPLARTFLILLANRVHPTRDWGTNTAARRALGSDLADAIPVRPRFHGTPWRAERRDSATLTLTATLPGPAHGRASFFIWFDTETHYDTAFVETGDGATWTVLDTFNGYGARRWLPVSVDLPPGATQLRWRYVTDGSAQGRGVYVDHVTVAGRPLAERDFTADGWFPSRT